MITLLLIGGCILGLMLLAGVIIVVVIMQGGQRDVVSDARQSWIFRRSEKDEEEW